MRIDHFTQREKWSRSDTLSDAPVHSEHGVLIRCDILIEISREINC
jgi:hypothetical protein